MRVQALPRGHDTDIAKLGMFDVGTWIKVGRCRLIPG